MVKWLFDEVVLKLNFKKFVLLSILYLVLGLIFVILFYINSLWKKRFENKIVLNLEMNLLKKTFNHDLKEYNKKGSGYFINSIHKDVQEGVVPFIEMFLTIVAMVVSEIALILKRIENLIYLKKSKYYDLSDKIKLENIKLSYEGKKVIEIKELTLKSNKKVLFVGPNGSGKTTLLDIISGHLAPDEGKVFRPEKVISLTAPVELPQIMVEELIKDAELIKKLGLEKLKDKYPQNLSAGEKQKVAIGIALENEGDVYIFDEPVANIDEKSKKTVLDLILEKTKNKPVIMVLHGEKDFHELFDMKLNIEEI